MAMRYGIDPHLLLALRRQENGAEDVEFGIKSVEAKNYLNQLNMAARSIQNSINRYERIFDADLEKDGHLTVEFMAFFSGRYCPPQLGGVNVNHLPGISRMYGKSIGKESEYTLNDSRLAELREQMKEYASVGFEIKGSLSPQELLANAKDFEGTRYRWGGNNKNGIDCSGLVIAAAENTVDGDTTAAGLDALSDYISPSAAKPGDAIFWNDGSHIALIEKDLGNGKYQTIEAAKGLGKVGRTTRDLRGKHVGRLPFVENTA